MPDSGKWSHWTGKKKIMLVEDHPFTRLGMAQFIDQQPDFTVCGQAGSPKEAMSLLEAAAKPDLILTDLTLPGKGGLEFIKDLRAQYPEIPVLVFSMHEDPTFPQRALLAGARGYLLKSEGGTKLLNSIRQVLRGKISVSEEMSAHLLEHFTGRSEPPSDSPIGRLTDRELEIFRLLGQARSTRQIADEFGISFKTVETHLGNIKQKLGVGSLRELVRIAVCWVEERRKQVQADGLTGDASASAA